MRLRYVMGEDSLSAELDSLLRQAAILRPVWPKFEQLLQEAINTIMVEDRRGKTYSIGAQWLVNNWVRGSEHCQILDDLLVNPFELFIGSISTNEYLGNVLFESHLIRRMDLEQRDKLFRAHLKKWGPPVAHRWLEVAQNVGIYDKTIVDALFFLIQYQTPARIRQKVLLRFTNNAAEVSIFVNRFSDKQIAQAFTSCVAYDPAIIMQPAGPLTFLARVEERIGVECVKEALQKVFRTLEPRHEFVPLLGKVFVPSEISTKTYRKMYQQLIDTAVRYECMQLFEHFVGRLCSHRHFLETYRDHHAAHMQKHDSSLPIVRYISNRLRKALRNLGWHIGTTLANEPESHDAAVRVVEQSSNGRATTYIAAPTSQISWDGNSQLVMFDATKAKEVGKGNYEVHMEQVKS